MNKQDANDVIGAVVLAVLAFLAYALMACM